MTGLLFVLMICSLFIVVVYKPKKHFKKLFINSVIIGIISGVSSSYLNSIFQEIDLGWYVFSSILYTLLFMAGYIMAQKVNLPIWWSKNKSLSKFKQVVISIVIGCLLGTFLILIQGIEISDTSHSLEVWNNMIDIFKQTPSPFMYTTLASVQAGFTEEILFRIFLIPLLVFILSKNTSLKPKYQLIIALIISALLFGLPPVHSFILAAIMGLLMGVLYLKLGFISLVIIHIIADIINLGSFIL